MSGFQGDFSVEQFDAAGQAVFFRVLVPLVQDVQLFGGRRVQMLHAPDHLGHAGAARAVEATGLHFDPGAFTRLQEGLTGFDIGGGILRQDGDLWHE